jgi:hypothetical protein
LGAVFEEFVRVLFGGFSVKVWMRPCFRVDRSRGRGLFLGSRAHARFIEPVGPRAYIYSSW